MCLIGSRCFVIYHDPSCKNVSLTKNKEGLPEMVGVVFQEFLVNYWSQQGCNISPISLLSPWYSLLFYLSRFHIFPIFSFFNHHFIHLFFLVVYFCSLFSLYFDQIWLFTISSFFSHTIFFSPTTSLLFSSFYPPLHRVTIFYFSYPLYSLFNWFAT